jgi:Asp-tRNA(Asn)/Glu-tRNA(Gln) amidotransferase A subunit family amidase
MHADLDLCYAPVDLLARKLRTGLLSPVDLVRNALARIEEVNPLLNAFCFVYPDEALEQARVAEHELRTGIDRGPLHGIPIAIKDFTPTAGKVTTRGSYSHKDWVPDRDPVIVERLRDAGTILVGKTTTPEFAYSGFTRSPLWGDTRNPWDPSKTCGGSSGGSAVAVATGCVPLAEGTDMGGSVRIPASFCGIVGLKPSLGRIPMDIIPSVFDRISHFGPLTRSVNDAALFLKATEGASEADYQSQRYYQPLSHVFPRGVKGVRLALSPDLGYFAVDEDVRHALDTVAETFRQAGAIVEQVELDWTAEQVTDTWTDYWGAFLASGFGHTLNDFRKQMDPDVVELIEAGLRISGQRLMQIEQAWTRQWQSMATVLERYDALLCPTMALPPVDLHARDGDFTTVDAESKLHAMDMTHPFNNIGRCPALSVPCGWTGSGLPIGLQIVGRRFQDADVLAIGAAWEALRPWSDMRPPMTQTLA